jgi:hypothetical protein
MQCSKRGDGASCMYPSPQRAEHDEGPRSSEAQLRLRKLEEMVNSLIQHKPGSESPGREHPLTDPVADSSLDLPPDGPTGGQLKNNNGSESNYLGATHWQAILQNVSA